MKKKYFYKVSFGFVGCDRTGLLETELSDEKIDEHLREFAIENSSDYGFYQDEDHFGDLDSVGGDWEEGGYLQIGELEYWFEEYIPEKHDIEVICVEFEEI